MATQPLNFRDGANSVTYVSASASAGTIVTDSGVLEFHGKTTSDPCYLKNGRLLPNIINNSSDTTITINLLTNNNYHINTSIAITTLDFTNCVPGQSGHVIIKNTAANTHNITYQVGGGYSSYVKFAGGTAPTLSTTSGTTDILSYYVYDMTCILVAPSIGFA